MARKLHSTLVAVAAALALTGTADAAGGNYVFAGGSEQAREQVRAALEASRFDWNLVSQEITIRITRCGCAGAKPGVIVLDEDVLVNPAHGKRYAWGIVQHEYAHQVDFFLFGPGERARVKRLLGGKDWCYEVPGVGHDDHGCERFAITLAWAYWRSADNIQRPDWAGAARVKPTQFRRVLSGLLAAPQPLS
jgi:hypothetical protein